MQHALHTQSCTSGRETHIIINDAWYIGTFVYSLIIDVERHVNVKKLLPVSNYLVTFDETDDKI